MKRLQDSILFNIFLLIVAAGVGYGSFRMAQQAWGVWRESLANRKKIAELAQRKQELTAYLQRLQTPGAIEEQARERMNLKLPGEEVVVVVAEQASTSRQRVEQARAGLWNWLTQWWRRIR